MKLYMNKLKKIVLSMQFAGFLLLLYGAAIGTATIIETAYDIDMAKILVYNSRWLEVVYLLLSISLVGNFFRFKLYRKSKWTLGLFHLSFFLMVIGGAATRYLGEEGMMHIREDDSSSQMLSGDSYMTVVCSDSSGDESEHYSTAQRFSQHLTPSFNYKSDSGVAVEALKVMPAHGGNSVSTLLVEVSYKEKSQKLSLMFQRGVVSTPKIVVLDDITVTIGYGQKIVSIPFELYLDDFILTKYPGSNSPSSYESHVTLNDVDNGVSREERIFMNNVLDYRGYRFFQSSYDQDERGTVLSVSRDGVGTTLTYLSYILMTIGMSLSLFSRDSYLVKRLKSIDTTKGALSIIVILGLSITTVSAGESDLYPHADSDIVDRWGALWIQGSDGRIEPISTYAGELMRKVYGKETYDGLHPEGAILSMLTYPKQWKSAPIIKVSNKELAKYIGIKSGKYCSFNDLFTEEGGYRLYDKVQEVYRKSTSEHNMFEKELIKVDERINVTYGIFTQSLFSLFPPMDKSGDDSWLTPKDIKENSREPEALFMRNAVSLIASSLASEDIKDAEKFMGGVEKYQANYGREVVPSEQMSRLEIGYNRASIFKKLFPFYLVIGILLFFIYFVSILKNREVNRNVRNGFMSLLLGAFVLHTIALVVRGVISGHMPWSNGYESMLYVAWAGMLAGVIFARKSMLVLSAASLLSGIFLLVAHLSWMNPEITNLVPVLKSYWLTFHVAIITASYGFIGLSSLLGLFNMILMIFVNEENRARFNSVITNLTSINEISVIIGIYLLTIGTFLGGVWANESWGRYWGWDPKETWSLVTIVVYTFVSHLRLIPGLKDRFTYNFASCISFSSVLMTYLGVNYYLTGLHSYGASEAGSTPSVLLGLAIFVAIVSMFANYKESRK